MNYLSVEGLTKSFDERLLFEGITFGLDQGQKAALVGLNGSGKSTLLRIIAGDETSEKGVVSFKNGLVVSMLGQNPDFDPEQSIAEAIFSDPENEMLILIREYELAILKTSLDPEKAADLTPLLERMDNLNAWEMEHQVKSMLGKLGLYHLEQKMGDLSGGQRKRVFLAQALVVNPDFLILDEPTNHLDLEVIEWLEDFLASQNLTLLMVTHDRYFLDRVTNEILELSGDGITRYQGNYSEYLQQKAQREEIAQATLQKAQNLYRKELEWIRRQPKARGTKAKYRVDAFEDLKATAHQSTKKTEMEVNLQSERQGKKILEVEQLSKSFGDTILLKNFEYVFRKKERVGVIGPNGTGKSTFLNLLTGNLAPDQGKVVAGLTTRFGYYTQLEPDFNPEQKVIDTIKEVAEVIELSNGSVVTASQVLNQFLFPPKMRYNFVGKLSGGEKRRLQLLKVLMANPNFLILDEPTNDLDITTLNILEDWLDQFDGCLMIVSHDRYFMDRLVEHLSLSGE
jgi:ATP-binding cassette subfamily F protein uup